jgi:Telomere recombination
MIFSENRYLGLSPGRLFRIVLRLFRGEVAMTAPLTTRVLRADAEAIAEAVRVLQAGGLVAFPTETVYGLGADAARGEAVARLKAGRHLIR